MADKSVDHAQWALNLVFKHISGDRNLDSADQGLNDNLFCHQHVTTYIQVLRQRASGTNPLTIAFYKKNSIIKL